MRPAAPATTSRMSAISEPLAIHARAVFYSSHPIQGKGNSAGAPDFS